MKKTFFLVALMATVGALNAQNLLLEEDFEYDYGRPLISDPVENSDNFDAVTGWSTQENSQAALNRFDIVEGNLTYEGYPGGQYGNSLHYDGTAATAGQGVFKLFPKPIKNDSNIYIAFLIKFDKTEVEVTASDYFFGIKMEPQAKSTNWGGRVFAAIDPEYPGEEVTFSVAKASSDAPKEVSATGPFFTMDQTILVVLKYHVGVLNGTTAAEEEANGYDDKMYLYLNPSVEKEPETPSIFFENPKSKDIYRISGSGNPMGSARGFYLRSSALGGAPSYTIDGIRVGLSWDEVMGSSTPLKETTANKVQIKKYVRNGIFVIEKNGIRLNALGTAL